VRELALSDLPSRAHRVREHVVGMATGGGCFLGASLSCVDLMVYLYSRFLRVDREALGDPDRDYLFLSKGHDVPALYGTLADIGWIEASRLRAHLDPKDSVYWHPNRDVPGVEFHSGSLGHLLSVAVGVAYDCKREKRDNRIVVVVGDGELDEGSNWEALLVAKAYGLDNLLVVVDRNHFQANVRTEELIPLEPLAPKFEAFGAGTRRVNGHDFAALEEAFGAFPYGKGGPSVLIADTRRGKGLPSIEERADRWFCNFNGDEVTELLRELRGQGSAQLHSEKLTVR
jgi:transketolase